MLLNDHETLVQVNERTLLDICTKPLPTTSSKFDLSVWVKQAHDAFFRILCDTDNGGGISTLVQNFGSPLSRRTALKNLRTWTRYMMSQFTDTLSESSAVPHWSLLNGMFLIQCYVDVCVSLVNSEECPVVDTAWVQTQQAALAEQDVDEYVRQSSLTQLWMSLHLWLARMPLIDKWDTKADVYSNALCLRMAEYIVGVGNQLNYNYGEWTELDEAAPHQNMLVSCTWAFVWIMRVRAAHRFWLAPQTEFSEGVDIRHAWSTDPYAATVEEASSVARVLRAKAEGMTYSEQLDMLAARANPCEVHVALVDMYSAAHRIPGSGAPNLSDVIIYDRNQDAATYVLRRKFRRGGSVAAFLPNNLLDTTWRFGGVAGTQMVADATVVHVIDNLFLQAQLQCRWSAEYYLVMRGACKQYVQRVVQRRAAKFPFVVQRGSRWLTVRICNHAPPADEHEFENESEYHASRFFDHRAWIFVCPSLVVAFATWASIVVDEYRGVLSNGERARAFLAGLLGRGPPTSGAS